MDLTTIIGIVVVAVIVMAVINRRAVGRMFKALSGQVGNLGRAAEEADPLTMYREAVDDGVEQIRKAKAGLERAKGLVRSVTRQVEDGEKDQARLENRIQVALDNGDPNNTAENYAVELARVEEDLANNREQLERHTESYNGFLEQVQLGQRKVSEARQKADRLGVQLEQSQREAEMAEFAGSFDAKLDDGDLSRAEQLIQQKIDANRAKGDVARDLNAGALAEERDRELERKAAANSILDRFKKKDEVASADGTE